MTSSSPETARLEAHLEYVRADIGQMKTTLSDVARAIQTLSKIEARQDEHKGALERAFGGLKEVGVRVDALSARVAALESAQPMARQTQGIVNKAVEVVLIAVLGALIALVVVKPAEVKAQPVVIQASPGGKGMEGQTHGTPK